MICIPSMTVTSYGQIWDIGKHALLCADAGDSELVSRLMDTPAKMVFTSPPYLQQRDYTQKIVDWDGLMQSVFSNLIVREDAQVLVNLGLVHKNGELVRYWDSFIDWMCDQKWKFFDWYVWDKMSPLPGNFKGHLLPSHDWIFHFCKQICQCKKTIPSKDAGRRHDSGKGRSYHLVDAKKRITTELYKKNFVINSTRVPSSIIKIVHQCNSVLKGFDHPAVFPVLFPEFMIPIWTDIGDIVYEPFSGSGSTIIACQNTRRICRAVEIAPEYCDIALLRFHVQFPEIPITLRDTGQVLTDFPEAKECLKRVSGFKKNYGMFQNSLLTAQE